MAELHYYIATSLDGFIAHEDGSYDGFSWDQEFVEDFFRNLSKYDSVLMGRKTYEAGLKEGKTNPYPGKRQFVFSKTLKGIHEPEVEFVREDSVSYVRDLKSQDSGLIWLCGGSELATSLFRNKLIDKIIIKLNPVVFGTGIPLFSKEIETSSLEFMDQRNFKCGIIELKYNIK